MPFTPSWISTEMRCLSFSMPCSSAATACILAVAAVTQVKEEDDDTTAKVLQSPTFVGLLSLVSP